MCIYTLLIMPDAWRQMVNGSLFLFKTKQKASLYFTNWRHISGIINKVYKFHFSRPEKIFQFFSFLKIFFYKNIMPVVV